MHIIRIFLYPFILYYCFKNRNRTLQKFLILFVNTKREKIFFNYLEYLLKEIFKYK